MRDVFRGQAHFGQWKTGPFEESFRDLSLAAKDIEALELSDVNKYVSDSGSKNTEDFEALGMKFPVEQITIWGTVLLLGIQLYFVTCLNQLLGKLTETDLAWDVPWIGLDSSTIARILYFCSVLLVPLLALTSLFESSSSPLLHDAWAASSHHLIQAVRTAPWGGALICKLVAINLAVASSIYLGTISWLKRPMISSNAQVQQVGEQEST